MNFESLRMQAVQPPIIPTVAELIRQTPGTISLGQGVVSYGPPPEAIEQLSRFLANPTLHQYQAVIGIPELLQAIEAKLAAENGIGGAAQQVVVTAGSNMGFVNAVLAIADPGDEIILQTPYYFNHDMAVRMANCRPVLVPTTAEYQLQPAAIQAAITSRTRAIVTVSPNNPTGAVYPEADLRCVNALCQIHGIYHIHDAAYEYFTYGVPQFSPGAIAVNQAQTISLFSLSKAYGFASWRIGYMVIPAALLSAVQKIQDTVAICPSVISQYAAIGALQAGWPYCQPHLKTLAEVRQICLDQLAQISDLCLVPVTDGAFYLLLKVQTEINDLELVKRLIREYRVAVIPGSTFGLTGGYLRVAYGALQPATVAEGMGRLVAGLRGIVGS
ncbi:MAG: pyridoxal phosphate-dependent aminotransferase [Pegethrix bostrychoides GSE-TBD4-15B]|jgi:aspartate/methionine/tyrosine aminotransferase|uniref:Pyridoxal phosphate-dependent aminotransferase n=1 Tax=Pegethrix bostrychoides GSE-TBD4-15B TaxID=2839662 RepID=A0A951U772_9CYAN|nr:pyridoxal phosphate-dependent aminotransferase [Pegethrix bostrychoides GSE-TBD4-15B]